jgi:predicted Rossmann-fold nucleotide-binding protein
VILSASWLSTRARRPPAPNIVDVYDVIIYTGSGLMGREVTNIRSSDMVVILGGRSGTLGEFAVAYDEGKLIGVLEGTGGIVEEIPHLVERIHKDSGAHLIYDADPEKLIARLGEHYTTHHYKRPSCFREGVGISNHG